MRRRRVAVIGAGVSGLTAAYLLRRGAEVTLFEADDRLGGHAHTHDVGGLAVDSGFIVHNERTYPHLLWLFAELGVATRPTEMSMSVRCEGCGLEYAGARGLPGLLARPRNALDPRFLAMLAQVPRFHRAARALVATGDDDTTIGEFARDYSSYFVRHFLVPVVSAVWSCGPERVGDYPARYLFVFLERHGMLSVTGSPTWRTVTGGSRTYVDRIAAALPAARRGVPVRSVTRVADGVEVRDEADFVQRYDAAVIATHADQALALRPDASRAEKEILGAFGYSRNETLLHSDASVLPRRRRARASWNYLLPACDPGAGRPVVSYDMNRLQRLDAAGEHVVTLNPDGRVHGDAVLARMVYRHPVYTAEAVAAQRRLPEISDATVAYAGAYHGWGFHEDGCRSGFDAAGRLA
ncbi:amine oxidase [Longispora fulva]|uniref:Putative NAD/FAD-binding protein n=1 Tax=Longispora fulva TaxID=619741 RepID=A0A8J7GSD1_9ACTN|nr:FAD-dependent oxidoreductase [Longispora fulva]MBG6137789.1 putative NAD/FAD-binding protein [Longispora fulva]GIG62053.1 amine oxidase [Longispora fulva]